MRFIVQSSGDSKLDKKVLLIEKAADFFARELIPLEFFYRNITVSIKLDDKELSYKQKGCIDYCINDLMDRKPAFFEIILRPFSHNRKMLIGLAHEMIHLKQLLLEELSFEFVVTKGGMTSIKKLWKQQDMTDVPYASKPWELEALNLQNDLAKAFFDSLEQRRKAA